MGAWDHTCFGNDAAADWLMDLTDHREPLQFLEKTPKEATEEYLETDEASAVIAAAAVVAAARGRKANPEEVDEWVRPRKEQLARLAPIALKAVTQVQEESELLELWEESNSFSDWSGEMENLMQFLRAN